MKTRIKIALLALSILCNDAYAGFKGSFSDNQKVGYNNKQLAHRGNYGTGK